MITQELYYLLDWQRGEELMLSEKDIRATASNKAGLYSIIKHFLRSLYYRSFIFLVQYNNQLWACGKYL